MSTLLRFQVRGREVTRLEAFSDAVFGFAGTLLVVSLEVPKSYDELMASLRGFIPFAACFAILVWIWSCHNGFFRRYGLQDSGTTLLNSMLLFMVLFFVYPLRMVFTAFVDTILAASGVIRFEQIAVYLGGPSDRMNNLSTMFGLYGLGFAAIFGCLALLYRHALRHADELELDPLERFDAQSRMGEFLLFVGIGVAGAVLGFSRLGGRMAVGGWVYGAIGPVAAWWNVRRAKQRALLEQSQPLLPLPASA